MKKLGFVLLLIVFTTAAVQAQYYNEKEGEKLSKKEQRRQKKEESRKAFEINKALAMNMLENRDFVLMADRISSKTSAVQAVSRQVNYVMINGEDMTVQYGLNNASVGMNGLGGVTLEGKIKKFEVKNRGEGKPYMVTIQFQTPYINGVNTVQLNIKGKYADATLFAQGRQLNFAGVFATIENSGVIVAKTKGAFN